MRPVGLVLACIALVLTFWVSFVVVSGRADKKEIAWSQAFCAQGAPAVAPNQQKERGDLNVRFSSSPDSCNQIDKSQVEAVIARLNSAWRMLSRLGMPPPPRGRYVTLTRNLKGDSIRSVDAMQINPYRQGIGTLDINLTASPDRAIFLYGQANLILSEIAPGLSPQSRARLAGTFTQLALNRPITTIDADKFDQSGSYELWLGRKFGGEFLTKAISTCQKPCAWPSARDTALRQEGYNPPLLAEQWVKGLDEASQIEAKSIINSR